MPDVPLPNKPPEYLLPGQSLGKYKIRKLIGRGATADVYAAYNPDLNQDVAIKVLHTGRLATENAVQRLRREAQAIAALNQSNIIRVYDFQSDANGFFMVMELVNGPTLQDLIRSHPQGMPSDQSNSLFLQIVGAVAYAHGRKLVYREIKPSNVLIAVGRRAVLTDFGLALMADSARLTASGYTSGTPIYMAPELLHGEVPSPASDVYALGIMLYEMITGVPPFQGDSLGYVMRQHIDAIPTPPTKIVPTLSLQVERVILKALQKKAADRFPTAREMLQALVAEQSESVGSATIELPPVELAVNSTTANKPTKQLTSTSRVSTLITQTLTTMQRNPVLSAGFV